jgi:hypothetical protein
MKLFTANEVQKGLYIISPSGYGIHWPLIDEDLSFDYLMKLELNNQNLVGTIFTDYHTPV